MPRTRRMHVPLERLAIVACVLATSCQTSGQAVTDAGPPATSATGASLLPQTTAALPSFGFSSYERLLYQLRGTPVVVNLWASWCGPCRAETAILVAAAKRYGRHVQFLGVDYQDGRDAAATFLTEHSAPYPSVFDGSGEIHDHLGFVGLPDTLFYARDGTIAATWSGPLNARALEKDIEQIVSEG